MFNNLVVYLTHPHVEAWNFQTRHQEKIQQAFPEMAIKVCYRSNEFLQALPSADTVIIWFFKKEWLELSQKLKWIYTPAAGKDWIEVEPHENLSVTFGGFHGPLIAESVLGAVLYFCKAFGESKKFQSKRRWARIKLSKKLASLQGARMTILGFGRIGQEIGRKLKPFGCEIIGIKRSMIDPPDYFSTEDKILLSDRTEEAFQNTDHLILVLPGGSETQGLMTRSHFRLLPKSSFLYNVGRGNVYQEDDLMDALCSGDLAGAYLDVFEEEPLPENSKLWDLDNVLIQPHLSAASPQYLDLFVNEWIQKVRSL